MKNTRSLAGFLVVMMLATCFAGVPVSATATAKTETELLGGFAPAKTIDFSTSTGSLGYYEYYALSEKVNGEGKNYQEASGTFTVDSSLVGTGSITNGALVLDGADPRPNLTENGRGVAFGKGADGTTVVTATGYPSVKWGWNESNCIDWDFGQKISFKIKFDALGADQNKDYAEIAFYSGGTRIALRFMGLTTSNGLAVRDSDHNGVVFPLTHDIGTTYQYLLEPQSGGDDAVFTDDYVDIYRRAVGESNFAYIGRATGLKAHNSTRMEFLARPNTEMTVDDIILYDVEDTSSGATTKTESALMADFPALKGGKDFSAATDLGEQTRTQIANFTRSGTTTDFETLYPVTLTTETTGLSADSDGKYLKYTGHNVAADHLGWVNSAGTARTAEVNLGYGEPWIYANSGDGTTSNTGTDYTTSLIKYRFRLTGTGAVTFLQKCYSQINFSLANASAFTNNGVSVTTGAAGTWHEVIVVVTEKGKYADFWYSNDNSDTYTYAGQTNILKTAASPGRLTFMVPDGTTMELDHVLIYGAASASPTATATATPTATATATPTATATTPSGNTKTEAEMLQDFPYVYTKQDYDTVNIGSQGRGDATKVTQVTEDGASAMKIVGHNYLWAMSGDPVLQTAQFNINEGAIDYCDANGISNPARLISIRFKMDGTTGIRELQLRDIENIPFENLKNGSKLKVGSGPEVTMGSSGWHEITVKTYESESKTYGDFWYRNGDGNYQFFGTTSIERAGKQNPGRLTLRVEEGTTLYIDSITTRTTIELVKEDTLLGGKDTVRDIAFASSEDATTHGTLSAFNSPDSYSATVNNNKLELRVGTTGNPTSGRNFYGQYKLAQSFDLKDGEFLRIKGTATTGKPVYFEFDIQNPGSRLRLIASETKVTNAETEIGSGATHTAGTSYDYLISRYLKTTDTTDGASGTYYYKVWRKVGNETDFIYLGETKRQGTNTLTTGTVTIKVMDGSGFDIESVKLYGKASDYPSDDGGGGNGSGDNNDTPTTPTVTTKTEAELFADFHYIHAKQDYNTVNIGSQGRGDATKVSKVTKDGASAMRIIGHNYTWNGQFQTAEFNIDDAAIDYCDGEGKSSPPRMIGIRFKIEGDTGLDSLQLRDVETLTYSSLKNGSKLKAGEGPEITMGSSGWHEIVVITYEKNSATFGEFWYRNNNEDFKYFGTKSIEVSSKQNAGRLTVRVAEGTTLYIDSITTRKKDTLVTEASVIALSPGKITDGAVNTDASAKKLQPTGSFSIGTEDSSNVRRAMVITAGYNQEHGYTTYVNTKEYPKIYTGTAINLADNIDVSGVPAEVQTALLSQDTLGLLVWDTLHNATGGTGIALCEPTYTKKADNAVVPVNGATGAPETGQALGVTATSQYNAVSVKGYIGLDANITAMILSGETIKAVAQTKANAKGMVDFNLSVDPYQNNGGSYTLWYQYGSVAPVSQAVTLYCKNDLQASNITDKAGFVTFVNSFGNAEEKTAVADDGFAQEAYDRFIALGGMGSGGEFDFFGFPSRVSQAIADEQTERAMVSKVSVATDWQTMKNLVVDTYGGLLGITEETYKDIKKPEDLFRRMIGQPVTNQSEVYTAFVNAYNTQKQVEAANQSGNGSGSGWGGGTNQFNNVGVTGGSVAGGSAGGTTTAPVGSVSNGGVSIFDDLDTVPWAEESILALKKKKILSGDDSGHYYPDNAITREEFLKLVMNAVGIPAGGEVSFDDVNADEWYYPFVAGAYQSGIVKGVSENAFGIGSNITRADMAVMLVRALQYKGVAIDPQKAAFIFADFAEIPDYATESIALLSEAGLMNGVGDNRFAPLANTTRAEAAVAIYRIFEFVQKGV